MIPSERIEAALYHALKENPHEWRTVGLGNLASQVGCDAGLLVDTLKRLESEEYVQLKKHFNDRGYVEGSNSATDEIFFYTGHFMIRVAPKGHPYFERLIAGKVVDSNNTQETVMLDHLTSLHPRKQFDEDLSRFADDALKVAQPLSLLMIDIDKFKLINDTRGHPFGDAVLKECAKRIRARTDKKGKVYRYGGEEIGVLLPNFNVHEATATAETVRRSVAEKPIDGVTATVSIGLAVLPEHGGTGTDLLREADKALYHAKNLGRNLVHVSGESTKVPVRERPVERRSPEPDGFTEVEQKQIRQAYFQSRSARCPRDQSILRIEESWRVGESIARILAICPFCGTNGVF